MATRCLQRTGSSHTSDEHAVCISGQHMSLQMARKGLVRANIPIPILGPSPTLQEASTMTREPSNDTHLMANPPVTEKVPSSTEKAQPQQCAKKTDDNSQSSDKDQGMQWALLQPQMHRSTSAQPPTCTLYNNPLEIVQTIVPSVRELQMIRKGATVNNTTLTTAKTRQPMGIWQVTGLSPTVAAAIKGPVIQC